MGKLVKGVNDLRTWCLENGDFGQRLMNEWTGELESGEHIEIDEITYKNGRKVKWKCSKGHEWYVTIASKTSYKTKCPYCFGTHIVRDDNSLKTWCLSNSYFGKQLMNEWTGELENGKHIEIDEIAYGSSHKKVKWKCSKGHERLGERIDSYSIAVKFIRLYKWRYDCLSHYFNALFLFFSGLSRNL